MLQAAHELGAARLTVSAETIERMMARYETTPDLPPAFRRFLSQATEFLTQVLECALAFDAPELVEAQGVWVWEMLRERGVPSEWMRFFLELYRSASEAHLSPDTHARTSHLVRRLAAMEGVNFTPHSTAVRLEVQA